MFYWIGIYTAFITFTVIAGLVVGKVTDYVRMNSYPRLLPKRDLMAPNTDPTDEELRTVMVEAKDEAVRKRMVTQEELNNLIKDTIEKAKERKRKGIQI